ncbi:hypothetical protein [uncultured Algimonas sp.]|uniref:hypothetical protein n=1 Tax=uncultured Algimonas sp. TaxID=1547920 RepID=UPI002605E0E8|nr:hypothetical protein [uncultured Algimonas sp.]
MLRYDILAIALFIAACTDAPSDEIDDGGLTPPPGFLEKADADCRAESDTALGDADPQTRQLNGQTLLTYVLETGGMAQCSVRHADGSVIDMRVIGTE